MRQGVEVVGLCLREVGVLHFAGMDEITGCA